MYMFWNFRLQALNEGLCEALTWELQHGENVQPWVLFCYCNRFTITLCLAPVIIWGLVCGLWYSNIR